MSALLRAVTVSTLSIFGVVGCQQAELDECKARSMELEAKVAELEKQLAEQKVAGPEKPEWVDKGAYQDGDVAYAVGMVTGVRNPALARVTADNRARAALATFLDVTQLNGVQIVDHWTGPAGELYALAKLEVPAKAD